MFRGMCRYIVPTPLITTSTFHNTVQRMVEIIAMMAVSLMSRDNSLINDSNGRRNKNMTVENIIYICTIYIYIICVRYGHIINICMVRK